MARQKAVLKLLLPYKDKIMTLENMEGITGLHPLSPSLRSNWKLSEFEMPDLKDEPLKSETDSKKKRKQAENQVKEQEQEAESSAEIEAEAV